MLTDVMCQHAVMVMAVLVSLSLMTQDSVIFERLQSRDPFKEVTEKVLQQFAEEGLRTLCLAELDLTEDVYRVHGKGDGEGKEGGGERKGRGRGKGRKGEGKGKKGGGEGKEGGGEGEGHSFVRSV